MAKRISIGKRFFFAVFLFVGLTLVASALTEVVLRLSAGRQLRSMLTIARVMHYRNGAGLLLTPGLRVEHTLASDEATYPIRINAQGLRADREYAPAPEPNVARVLVMGDSFTFGIGVPVEQTYAAVLETLLNDGAADERFEVINTGFANGDCPLPQYLYLKERGLAFAPRVVVVGFYADNDLHDMDVYRVTPGPDGLPASLTLPGGDLPWWIKRTALYQQVGLQILQPRLASLLSRQNPVRPHSATTAETSIHNLEQAMNLFAGMQRLATAHAARLVVMYIPAIDEAFGERADKAQRLRAALTENATRRGFAALDLTAAVRAAGPDVYLPIDHHFSALGHLVVARTLAEALRAAQP